MRGFMKLIIKRLGQMVRRTIRRASITCFNIQLAFGRSWLSPPA